jgi:hypothetical protein
VSENQVVQPEEGALAKIAPTEVIAYNPDDPVSLYMSAPVFDQLQRVANLMAHSMLVPEHLRGKVADCFLVCSQAIRWGMDPFAAAQHIYIVHGKVGWEGKIVAAIINSKLPKGGKLRYEYSGPEDMPDREVVVYGTLPGEKEPRTVKGTIKKWATKNEQWTSGDQMLAYRGAREWARRHMPEAVLGVYSDDEVRDIAVKEKDTATDDALGDLLDPAKVTEENDPPEKVGRKTATETNEDEPSTAEAVAKTSQSRRKANAKKAASKKKEPPKKPVFKPGDKMPDGKIVEEVDDEGHPTVLKPAPKPEPKEKKKPEPKPEGGTDTSTQDEIDALFAS